MTKPRTLQLLLGIGPTARLLEHVRHLQSVNTQLHACLDIDAAVHAQVADLNAGRLLIHADSAAWATRLRYLAPQMLRCLQKSPLLTDLKRIDIRVSPQARPAPPATQHRPMLSTNSAEVLDSTADNLSDSALRTALKRLARRGNGKPQD